MFSFCGAKIGIMDTHFYYLIMFVLIKFIDKINKYVYLCR